MTIPEVIRRSKLEERLGLSRSSIYKMMADGRFPRPIKLGQRSVGCRTAEIERWLDEMQEASNEFSLKTPPSQTDMSVFAGHCLFFGCRPHYYLTHHKLSFLALRARPKIWGRNSISTNNM